MEQETRGEFFSLGCSSGSARVYDDGVAGSGEQGPEASRDDAAASGSGQQTKKGTAGHGRNNKQPFSANFGTKQAWASVQQPAIRTQGRHDRENRVDATSTTRSLSQPQPVRHMERDICVLSTECRTAVFTCSTFLKYTSKHQRLILQACADCFHSCPRPLLG